MAFFSKPGWRTGILASAIVVVVLLAAAGSIRVLHKTSDTAFCVSCHSMQRPLAEYQGSIHFQNHAGIRAECADCHVPGEPVAWATTKLGAIKDVVGELTGKIDTEEKYNSHKLAMAESVWQKMKASDSATCRSCHSFAAMDILGQQPEARKAHPVAMKEGRTCIDCHRGVAHILPDMRNSNANGAAQLASLAAATRPEVPQLYSISTQPFTLQPGVAPSAGTLFPATGLKLLQREKNLMQVALSGWQQDGVPGVIYAAPGKRIISAIVAEESLPHIITLGSQPDRQTGMQWHQVQLNLWVSAGALIGDRQKIWQYAAGLMTANCTGCHGLTPLDHYTANQWIGVIKGMAPRTSLDQEQLRLLTQYVQQHASDMAPASQGIDNEK